MGEIEGRRRIEPEDFADQQLPVPALESIHWSEKQKKEISIERIGCDGSILKCPVRLSTALWTDVQIILRRLLLHTWHWRQRGAKRWWTSPGPARDQQGPARDQEGPTTKPTPRAIPTVPIRERFLEDFSLFRNLSLRTLSL